MPAFKPPGQCPACGEWIPRQAVACDCCGACAKSGWKSESDVYDGLDLPDDDFDYDAFIAEEFGEGSTSKSKTLGNLWWWVAIVLLAAIVLGYLLPLL
jgi:hypothetical protein